MLDECVAIDLVFNGEEHFFGEVVAVVALEEQAGAVVLDDEGHAADAAGDDEQAGVHGFEERDGHVVHLGRGEQDVGAVQLAIDFAVVDAAGEGYVF